MFELGASGNKQGRPTGSQIKVSIELRQAISDFLMQNLDEVRELERPQTSTESYVLA